MIPMRQTFLALAATLLALLFSQAGHAQARATQAATPQAKPAALVEGQDYIALAQALPFANAKGKIEIAEVFGYWCHFCNDFQPMVDAFKARLPADIDFVYVPAAFDADDAFARAFFAARQLKLPARLHNDLFRAVHVDRTLPKNASERELAAFHAGYGVSADKFLATMNSPAVAAQMRWARKFIENADIPGTPSLIVAGKYRVNGNSQQEALRIAGQLAAQLRAQQKR